MQAPVCKTSNGRHHEFEATLQSTAIPSQKTQIGRDGSCLLPQHSRGLSRGELPRGRGYRELHSRTPSQTRTPKFNGGEWRLGKVTHPITWKAKAGGLP
ncbi:hypothetical protein I79_002270 [Cricetulus griseus]|uniref:Uncharacterized protein n=1 Tax=Cricetulus griseus TaxID=10029 RepID=G3GWY4_CRIGR|nr:hypothetical protein I79_002270 [Cricetulus griseus]